jgi:acyl carrier protein
MPQQQIDVDSIEQRVFEVLRDYADDPASVSADTKLEEIGVDSLDLVELGQMVDDEYGIELTEEHFQDVTRVGDVIRVIRSRVG